MYLASPASVLEQLYSLLAPGGVCAFQEHCRTMSPARIGSWPVHDQVHSWVWETAMREGANPHLAMALPTMLASIGFVVESVRVQGIVVGYERGHHPYSFIARAMLPRMIACGVVDPDEVDIDDLERRLANERRHSDGLYVSDTAVMVVARKPATQAGSDNI